LLSFNPDLILDDGFDLTTMLVERFSTKGWEGYWGYGGNHNGSYQSQKHGKSW